MAAATWWRWVPGTCCNGLTCCRWRTGCRPGRLGCASRRPSWCRSGRAGCRPRRALGGARRRLERPAFGFSNMQQRQRQVWLATLLLLDLFAWPADLFAGQLCHEMEKYFSTILRATIKQTAGRRPIAGQIARDVSDKRAHFHTGELAYRHRLPVAGPADDLYLMFEAGQQ